MTETLDMKDIKIPDGILHDQQLEFVEFNKAEGKLVLNLKTHLFSDYVGNEFCEKYKDYSKCSMICDLAVDDYFDCFNYVVFETIQKENIFKSKILPIAEFEYIVNEEIKKQNLLWNHTNWTYVDTYINPNTNSAIINLSGCFLKGKYRKFHPCNLNIRVKTISWNWEL